MRLSAYFVNTYRYGYTHRCMQIVEPFPFVSRKLNIHQPISYEIGHQSRTSLVCKLVRDSFPKVQLSDNDNGTKTLWTANFSNMSHWVSRSFYIQNLEKRRKIVIFAVGYGIKAVTHAIAYYFALNRRSLENSME